MTTFTPGPLTASQAAALNDLMRQVRALLNMTATAPMQINRAGGALNLSLVEQHSAGEFDVMVIDRQPQTATVDTGATLYSWVKINWAASNPVSAGPHMVPDWTTMGTLNLKRNWSNTTAALGTNPPVIFNGQVVKVTEIAGQPGWFSTDAAGGMSGMAILYKDWNNNNAILTWFARDLIWYNQTSLININPPPITPPPGVTVPPAPTGGPGGG